MPLWTKSEQPEREAGWIESYNLGQCDDSPLSGVLHCGKLTDRAGLSKRKRAETMTTTEKTKLLTANDLLRLHSEGARGELIRGVFHKGMAAGVEHGELVMNLGFIVSGFTKPRRMGRVIGSDVGVRLERSPDTARELVWVIHPESRTVDVYRAGAPVETLGEVEELDGAPALPGFACAVRDVFDS